jgi:hypothetical protein
MQTASVKWIGEQKFSAVSPSGHAVAFDYKGRMCTLSLSDPIAE